MNANRQNLLPAVFEMERWCATVEVWVVTFLSEFFIIMNLVLSNIIKIDKYYEIKS